MSGRQYQLRAGSIVDITPRMVVMSSNEIFYYRDLEFTSSPFSQNILIPFNALYLEIISIDSNSPLNEITLSSYVKSTPTLTLPLNPEVGYRIDIPSTHLGKTIIITGADLPNANTPLEWLSILVRIKLDTSIEYINNITSIIQVGDIEISERLELNSKMA